MSKIIDKLAWIHIRDKRILSTLSKGKDTYYIPGGKREPGESDHEALTREVKEELDVNLIAESLEYLETFEAQAHGKGEGITVRMTCYTGDYEGTIRPKTEIEEVVWFRHEDREKSSAVDKIIFDWLEGRDLIG